MDAPFGVRSPPAARDELVVGERVRDPVRVLVLVPGRARALPSSPRSRRTASSGPAAARIASRSAAASSRPGSSSRVAPAPSRTPCRVAGAPEISGASVASAASVAASAAGAVTAATGRSRQKLARRAVPPATRGATAGGGAGAAERGVARRSPPVRHPPRRRVAAVGNDDSRNGPGEHRGPGVQGEAGDPGELAVGGAGQLLLDGHEGQPPGLEALDGDELEQVPRAVQGRPAAMGDRTVDQADGRVPADGPPVRDGADPAARLAVVVDGQRQVDPLGELVKGPAWFLHAPMVTVLYDSVN